LSGYRRPENLIEQFSSIKEQNFVDVEVMYWQNTLPGVLSIVKNLIHLLKIKG